MGGGAGGLAALLCRGWRLWGGRGWWLGDWALEWFDGKAWIATQGLAMTVEEWGG